jgi:hypothetical protein
MTQRDSPVILTAFLVFPFQTSNERNRAISHIKQKERAIKTGKWLKNMCTAVPPAQINTTQLSSLLILLFNRAEQSTRHSIEDLLLLLLLVAPPFVVVFLITFPPGVLTVQPE